MSYTIEYAQAFSWKMLEKIPKNDLRMIMRAIEEKLTTEPLLFGKPLRHTLKGSRRLRVGDYRIVFSIKNTTVTISYIENRKTVY